MTGRVLVVASAGLGLSAVMSCSHSAQENASTPKPNTEAQEASSSVEPELMDSSVRSRQESDSVVTGVIPPEGGTLELPGFATVTFPSGTFESPRDVTVAATNKPGEKGFFRVSVGLPTVEHEVRVLTGSRRPSEAIQVAVKVPEVFLNQVPANRLPVLFARERYSSPSETVDDYYRLESEFDEGRRFLIAEVEPRHFQEYETGKGLQAVLMISSAPRR